MSAFLCRPSGFDPIVAWAETRSKARYQVLAGAHDAGYHSLCFHDITVTRIERFDGMGPPAGARRPIEVLDAATRRFHEWRTNAPPTRATD